MNKKRIKKPDRGIDDSCLEQYHRLKSRYLSLCRRYGLNPFDLDILSISQSRIPHKDKTDMVRMIISLIRLERVLKGLAGPGLFPLTVKESERSGYLVPNVRAS